MSDHSVASFLHEGANYVPVYCFALFNDFQYVNNVILLEMLDGLGIEGTIVLLNNKSRVIMAYILNAHFANG